MLKTASLVGLALSCASCSGFEPPPAAVSVRMDAATFERDSNRLGLATIGFTVSNVSTSSPVYFQGCAAPFPLHVEWYRQGAWAAAFESGTACEQVAPPPGTPQLGPLRLDPGESYHASLLWDCPATYRFKVLFGFRADVPFADSAASASFAIQ